MLTESDEVLHVHATSGRSEVEGVVARNYDCVRVVVGLGSELAGEDDGERDEGRCASTI